jgi:hypothetical protein
MSYVAYCLDQAADCSRRAKLASSPEIAGYFQELMLRWLNIAGRAQWMPQSIWTTKRPTSAGLRAQARTFRAAARYLARG